MSDGWIRIPNWDDFQHYKDRDPKWIKTYCRLVSDDAYRNLTFHQRGVLHSLWMEYARANRQLRDNTATLTRQLGHRVMRRDLEALNHAGFIELSASTEKIREDKRSTSAVRNVSLDVAEQHREIDRPSLRSVL